MSRPMHHTDAERIAGDGYLLNIFLSPEGLDDPAPWYHRLRSEMPQFASGSGATFLTRYDDCRAVLRDNRFGTGLSSDGMRAIFADVSEEERVAIQDAIKERSRSAQPSMLGLNPPDHTRMRGLVNRAFTPRRIEAMRDHIGHLGEQCVDRLAAAGEGDAIEILGWLPVNVIGALVGVPEEDWQRFRPLVTTAVQTLEPTSNLQQVQGAHAAFDEMAEYFGDLVEKRRKDPQDDLISALIAVEEDGDRLTVPELISTVILLFSAGMETTQNLIGNGLGALFTHPGQMDKLWSNPDLVGSGIEEMLRWDSPVQLDGRTSLEPAEIAGEPVGASHRVLMFLGAANRDPEHFTDPDDFDITRDEGPPMSFGSGVHYCLGANLARAEGEEIFKALIKRFKTIELAGELTRRHRLTLRGYEAVPIRVIAR